MPGQIIKKKYKNEYLLAAKNIWVRNYTKRVRSIDINSFWTEGDFKQCLENQINSKLFQSVSLENELEVQKQHKNCLIVSDGLGIKDNLSVLDTLDKNITILGVNGIFRYWNKKNKMGYYVVNNPSNEAVSYLPKNDYYPKCISSSRTNTKFLKSYKKNGTVITYNPTQQAKFNPNLYSENYFTIDDYRNPVCAAIEIAFHLGVEKLLLLFCDDLIPENKPGTIQVSDNSYQYPQQAIAQSLIEGKLFWLKSYEERSISIGYYSKYPNMENANLVDIHEINNFFNPANQD